MHDFPNLAMPRYSVFKVSSEVLPRFGLFITFSTYNNITIDHACNALKSAIYQICTLFVTDKRKLDTHTDRY